MPKMSSRALTAFTLSLIFSCASPEKTSSPGSGSAPDAAGAGPASGSAPQAPALICAPSQSARTTTGNPRGEDVVSAAHEIMNTFYQNPRAAAIAPYETLKRGELKGYDRTRNEISKGSNSYVVDLAAARASQYYIRCAGPGAGKRTCDKLCETPPSYIWGGMGWYEPAPGKISFNVFSNFEHTRKISKHPGLDCSGLLYAVFARAGLRVTRDLTKTPSADTADNTPARTYLNTENPLSCFTEIAESSVRPGDIIPWKSHILMVDTLGADPFGVSAAKSELDCSIEKLDPSKATMVVYNSKGSFDFPAEGTETPFLKNAYYRKGFMQHILMYNRYIEAMKRKNPSFPGTTVDSQRFNAVKGLLTMSELNKIYRTVEKGDLQLTGVGVGISRMKLAEFVIGSPSVMFELMQRACLEKVGKVLAPKGEPMTKLVKVARHVATFPNARPPCECLAPDEQRVELVGAIDPTTAKEYCSP